MSGCKECGKELQRRNKSGYCRAHVIAAMFRDDADFRERHRASMRRKAAHDPVYLENLRARARALSADKDVTFRRTRHFVENRVWERAAPTRTQESYDRAARTCSNNRLAWCPPQLRDHYNFLKDSKGYRAAEARKMIEEQNELEMARWRRSVGIEVEPSKIEFVEPDYTPLEMAIELVAKRFGITIGKLFSSSRTDVLVRARCALAVAMKREGYSLNEIARAVHKTDHSTSIHWVQKGEKLCADDLKFRGIVDELVACWHAVGLAA